VKKAENLYVSKRGRISDLTSDLIGPDRTSPLSDRCLLPHVVYTNVKKKLTFRNCKTFIAASRAPDPPPPPLSGRGMPRGRAKISKTPQLTFEIKTNTFCGDDPPWPGDAAGLIGEDHEEAPGGRNDPPCPADEPRRLLGAPGASSFWRSKKKLT